MRNKFGVELESYGLDVRTISEIVTSIDNLQHVDNSHTHHGGTYFDGITWQTMRDGSISARPLSYSSWNNAGTHEVVSPVLKGRQGMQHMHKVMRALSRAGAKVNKSCGTHVTLDCNNSRWNRMSAAKKTATVEQIVSTYFYFSNVIESMLAPSRRNSSWAQITSSPEWHNKYNAVNVSKFARYGVIEFRQHQGTLNPIKLRNWVLFCQQIMNHAVNEEFANNRNLGDYPRTLQGMADCIGLNDAQVAFWTQRIQDLNNGIQVQYIIG